MALKINLGNNEIPGIIKSFLMLEGVSNIYIRIDRYLGNGNTCTLSLGLYSLTENAISGEIEAFEPLLTKLNFPSAEISFIVVEDNSQNDTNIRKQGYEYLKTLPEFTGCEDC